MAVVRKRNLPLDFLHLPLVRSWVHEEGNRLYRMELRGTPGNLLRAKFPMMPLDKAMSLAPCSTPQPNPAA